VRTKDKNKSGMQKTNKTTYEKNDCTKNNEAHKWDKNSTKRKPKADPAEARRYRRKRGKKAKVMACRRKGRSADKTPAGKVPSTDCALPLNGNVQPLSKINDKRGSPESVINLLPRTEIISVAPGPYTLNVSMATGMKIWECCRSIYLLILRASSDNTAAPAMNIVLGRCEGASLSGQVKSQIID